MNALDQLKPLLNQNVFTLFNLPLLFKIDQNLLAIQYKTLQKKFHPDNFTAGSSEIKLLVIKVSAHINHAYVTLKSPLLRSIALLASHGINLDLTKDTLLPEQFLFEQMELHEEIETAKGSINDLEQIEKNLNIKSRNLELNIEQAFNNNNLSEVTKLTKQLAFYSKINNLVADLITNLY